MIDRIKRIWIRRKPMVILIILLVTSGVVLGAVRYANRSPATPTFDVKRGEFIDSVQFRGEVKAMKSVTISAPAEAGDLQIVKIVADGTQVKQIELCSRRIAEDNHDTTENAKEELVHGK